jgi:CHASE2 domain-containing sensor protein
MNPQRDNTNSADHNLSGHAVSGKMPIPTTSVGIGWCVALLLGVFTYHMAISLLVPKTFGSLAVFNTWYYAAACWVPVVVVAAIVRIFFRPFAWPSVVVVLSGTCVLSTIHYFLIEYAHAYFVT